MNVECKRFPWCKILPGGVDMALKSINLMDYRSFFLGKSERQCVVVRFTIFV